MELSCPTRIKGFKPKCKHGESFKCDDKTPFAKDVLYVEKLFVAAEVNEDAY